MSDNPKVHQGSILGSSFTQAALVDQRHLTGEYEPELWWSSGHVVPLRHIRFKGTEPTHVGVAKEHKEVKTKCQERGLNTRPPELQSVALPAELSRRYEVRAQITLDIQHRRLRSKSLDTVPQILPNIRITMSLPARLRQRVVCLHPSLYRPSHVQIDDRRRVHRAVAFLPCVDWHSRN